MKIHCLNGLKNIVRATFLILTLSTSNIAGAQDATAELSDAAKAGYEIYEAECRTCHNFNTNATGPALKGVTKRQTTEWLTAWIDNPAKVIASGDKHANEMKAEYGQIMPTIGLNPEEISNVIEYLKVGKDPEKKVAVTPTTPGVPAEASNGGDTDTILFIVLFVLILVILILVILSSTVAKVLKTKDDAGELDHIDSEYVNQKHSLLSVVKSPTFIGIAIGVTLLMGAWFGVTKGLYGIGVQQGYAPTQPIAFSHKLHAGEHQIDCNYCHTSVRKAKHANIPSASICMNCHVKIKTKSEQIAQIYKAIDYNPETREFGDNLKPIEWVRIHNLPDHVYFNHSQHTKVAGLECEECHGEIKEMEKVYQYSPLTMGWCIDCHRKTEVGHAYDNDYYESLLKAHQESEGEEDIPTVEDFGGIECVKCHY